MSSDSTPTASSVPCCRLVVEAQTPVTPPVVADFIPSVAVDTWLVIESVDLSRLAFVVWQHLLIDASPPPDDLVITQLRMTI